MNERPTMSPGEKERGSAQEYPEEKCMRYTTATAPPTIDVQASPVHLRSHRCERVLLSHHSHPLLQFLPRNLFTVSLLRLFENPFKFLLQQSISPTPKLALASPIRSPHRKTPSTDKRMRKSTSSAAPRHP